MSLSVPLEPPSKEILHISAHYLVILVKYIYSIQFNSIHKKLRLCVYERLLPGRQVISDARVFRKTSHSLPITPEVEKTRGVKTPRSMLTTRWQYWRFFSCSFLTSSAWISDKVNSSALGWVTRMSKKKLPVVLSRIRGPWCLDGLRWIGLLTCISATQSQKAGGLAPPQRRNK